MLASAHTGSSAAKRMFFKLRNIRVGKVPFTSAVPPDDSLDKVLAGNAATVKLPAPDPFGPPSMRFHTEIYHPNISLQGDICSDYREKWCSVLSAGNAKSTVTDSGALCYQTKSTDFQWSLGALLTALCGLLASPDVDDPLVPEIAEKYIEDYDGYCENAKLYTHRYATGLRPDVTSLVFLEDKQSDGTVRTSTIEQAKPKPVEDDVISSQQSLGEKYDARMRDRLPKIPPGLAWTVDKTVDKSVSPASSADSSSIRRGFNFYGAHIPNIPLNLTRQGGIRRATSLAKKLKNWSFPGQ